MRSVRLGMACGVAVLLPLSEAIAAPPVDRLEVPPGFQISVYAAPVPSAREMALGARGTVFVGSMSAGKVYALSGFQDGKATKIRTIASDLSMPAGVAFHNGDLYVSDITHILVLRDIENHLDDPPEPEVAADNLPYEEGDHSWKFIAFGPDNRLYVPIGSPCNICNVGQQFGRIISMAPDGTDRKDVAYGIRNTVGFTWRPQTKALWFTDNGRDMMGDNLPSDELNTVTTPGESFGYPFCHQGDVPDPEFGKKYACSEFTPPAVKLGAHVAALGLRFYEGPQFPSPYKGALFIAEHGSWNRSRLSGYQVVAVPFGKDGNPLAPQTVVSGFQQNEHSWGRPADVQPLPDGSLLISDDKAGAVYRLTYGSGQ
ncbi:sorbosone dehydrogenase family protein [Acetobacter orientalis]|uniref:PQQ-dependent sugar dehydrogenase n=1 Tax=Acetobacter orientalis TaxID=146474 RepID=UPI00248D8E8E|nr:PQQ-dependent sugar dehydrogenase [Acetobacter orientalis]